METGVKFKTVDEYLSALPERSRKKMAALRVAIKSAAPDAVEVVSYNMPAFKYHGILVYYAAHKEHIGFYPGHAKLIEAFSKELVDFETSKGTIKFPLDKALPTGLIKKIVKTRVEENLMKAGNKRK